MEHYVKMTIDEYEELVNAKAEPSHLLKMENHNLKYALDKANKTILELEESLSQYAVGLNRSIGLVEALRIMEEEDAYTVTPEIREIHRASSAKRRWTTAEVNHVHSTVGRFSIDALASDMNRTISAVKTKAYELGYVTKNGFIQRDTNVRTN
jgi:hypothetical protein